MSEWVKITTYDDNGTRISLVRSAFVANNSPRSGISLSLARLLKIDPVEEVDCIDPIYGGPNNVFKNCLPNKLILVEPKAKNSKDRDPKDYSILVTPLIMKDCEYDIVLGSDFLGPFFEKGNVLSFSGGEPTHSPEYDPGVSMFSYNVGLSRGSHRDVAAVEESVARKWVEAKTLYYNGESKGRLDDESKSKKRKLDQNDITTSSFTNSSTSQQMVAKYSDDEKVEPDQKQRKTNEKSITHSNSTTSSAGSSKESGVFRLHFDGATSPNPGKGGIGIWITGPDNEDIIKLSGSVVKNPCTNNEAEYLALESGLLKAHEDFSIKNLEVYGDSELVIKQVTGVYTVRNKSLKPLWKSIQALIPKFDRISFKHIPRDINQVADRLAKKGICK